MNFDLTSQQEALRQTIAEFFARECPRQVVREWDEAGEFPLAAWRRLAGLGVAGWSLPEAYGGGGGDVLDQTLITEELSRRCFALASAFVNAACFAGRSLELFGSEAQRQAILPGIARGEHLLALSLTEPDGGTDILGALRTTATLEAGGWVINGQKVFTTAARESRYLIVVARSGPNPSRRSEGITLFIVPTETPGVECRRIRTVGHNSYPTYEVFYSGVRVPETAVLGEVGRGWYQVVQTLNNERIQVAALCVGLAQAALDDAAEYARNRHAFGKPIGQFQALQHNLADCLAALESARLMTYKAATLQAAGSQAWREAAMAKLCASETVVRITNFGMHLMGGYGYVMDYDMQRYWREARISTAGAISNDMIRNQLGESLGLPRSY